MRGRVRSTLAVAVLAAPLAILSSARSVAAAPAESASAEEASSLPLPPAPRVVTLDEALAYARAHQPAILATVARIGAAKESAQVPRSQWLPRIGVTAQIFGATANNTTASTVGTMPEVDIPRIGGTRSVSSSSASWSPYASTFVGIGGTQEVFDFGRIAAESAAADAKIEIAQQDAVARRVDIEFGVQEAYFAVYAAKGVLSAAEGAFQRSREHRDQAQAGVGSGLRSPIELTRANADLGRYDVGRIRARGNVQLAQSVLAASMGASDLTVDVTGEPPQLGALPTLQAALSDAETHSPWLLQALARLKQQERQTKAIRAEMRPNIELSATFSGRAGGAPPTSGERVADGGWVPGVPNWDVAILLSWPLFDGTINARANASQRLEEAQRADVDVARLTVNAAVDQAYVQLSVARDAVPALQRSLAGAVSNYAQANARFGAGLGNAVELADAEALRSEAEVQLALGAFEVARARAALGRALAGGIATMNITQSAPLTKSTRGLTHE